jgi:hypothetical protein
MLAYGYQPGTSLIYDLDQEMSMDMEASGEGASAAFGAGDMSMAMTVSQQLAYDLAEGPEPDTVSLTVTYEILDGSATITAAGQTQFLSFEDVAAQAAVPPVEVTLDSRGEVLDIMVGGESLPAELLDLGSGFGSTDLFQQPHLGPVFPDEPLEVGDSWEVDLSQSALGFDISQQAEYSIVAEERIAGRETLRIEGTVITDAVEISLADMLEALTETDLEGAGAAGDLDAQMFESLGIDIRYRLARSEMAMISWFDPGDGVVVRAEIEMPAAMAITMSGMPDAGGDLSMDIEMEMFQTLSLQQ